MKQVVDILAMILTAVGQPGIAAQLQADVAAGKLTVEEGVELAESVTALLEKYLPAQALELELGHDVAAALDTYLKAKAAQGAKPPVPTGSAPPTTGPGGPGGTIRS